MSKRRVNPHDGRAKQRALPGAAQQVDRDGATFFETDMPALPSWRFGREDARRIRQPTLYIGGTESGTWWVEVRDLILDWLPHAEDVMIEGADHPLAATHPKPIADALAGFLRNHPIGRLVRAPS